MSYNPQELEMVIAQWKAETENMLEARVDKKKLRDSGELGRSTKNIVWKINAGQLVISVTIAEHGRFLDMKTLRGQKNRNQWGYAKALWAAINVLEDRVVIYLKDYARRMVLEGFKNGLQ